MAIEIFDDGEAVTPEQKAALAAAFEAMMFGTGVVKLTHTKDGKVEISHIPIHDMSQPPKDPQ